MLAAKSARRAPHRPTNINRSVLVTCDNTPETNGIGAIDDAGAQCAADRPVVHETHIQFHFSLSRSRIYDNNLASLVMSANRRRVNRSFACFGLLTNVVATAGITIDALALVLLS